MDLTQLVSIVSDLLAPHLGALLAGGASRGAQAAYEEAEAIWELLVGREHPSVPSLKTAAQALTEDADDEAAQALFAKRLLKRVSDDRELVQRLTDALGGDAGVQSVVAQRGAHVARIKQFLVGPGEQTVHVTDAATAEDITQRKR